VGNGYEHDGGRGLDGLVTSEQPGESIALNGVCYVDYRFVGVEKYGK